MENSMNKINKVLLSILAGIIIIIVALSAIAVCTKNVHPGEGLRHEDPLPKSVGGTKTAFNHIGQIRAFTRGNEKSAKSVLVLTPWFEYDGNDKAFYEELDRKHLSLKALLTKYFSNHTKAELLKKGESQIKSELKAQINENLVLGKISEIYFNDYLFLD